MLVDQVENLGCLRVGIPVRAGVDQRQIRMRLDARDNSLGHALEEGLASVETLYPTTEPSARPGSGPGQCRRDAATARPCHRKRDIHSSISCGPSGRDGSCRPVGRSVWSRAGRSQWAAVGACAPAPLIRDRLQACGAAADRPAAPPSTGPSPWEIPGGMERLVSPGHPLRLARAALPVLQAIPACRRAKRSDVIRGRAEAPKEWSMQ